jgi:hypothetical protein
VRERHILFVNGGIGKHIEATAVARAIKKKTGSNITVISAHPEVFKHNQNLEDNYFAGSPEKFFKHCVIENKAISYNSDPYIHPEYIYDKLHFTKAWCKQLGIEDDGIKPDLFLTETEIEDAKDFLKERKIDTNKLVLFQWQGGVIPKSNSTADQMSAKKVMFRRSLPVSVAQEVADKLKEQGFTVWSIQHPQQYNLKDVPIPIIGLEKDKSIIMLPIRLIFAILSLCKTFIGIDSFLQHASAALDKKGIVCWGATDFRNDGYEHNINLEIKNACPTPHCHRPFNQMFDSNFECAYGEKCLRFTSVEILDSFDKLIKGE